MERTRTSRSRGSNRTLAPAATVPLQVEPVTTVPAPASANTRSIGRRKNSSTARSGRSSANLDNASFKSSSPSPFRAETASGACQRTLLCDKRSATSVRTIPSHSASTRSRLVRTGMPRRTPSSSDREMLFGLGHDSFVRGNHEEGDVDAGRTREHVLDEAFVTGDVDDAGLDAVCQRKGGESEIDRDAAPFLFFPAIGVDPGERLDERRLAVVDMSRRADYEPAGIHARRSQISMALDRCSLPFCATSPK